MRRAVLLPMALAVACSGGDDIVDCFDCFDAGTFDAGFYDGGRIQPGEDGGEGPRDSGPRDGGEGVDGGHPDAGRMACAFAGGSDLDHYRAVLDCLADPMASELDKRAFVGSFVTAVEAGDGFPIEATDGFVFVYVRTAEFDAEDDARPAEDFAPNRRHTPISVSGDFDMWTPGTNVMTDHGYDFFSREVALDTVVFPGARYKFVAKDDAGEDVWFSDPGSRRFAFDAFGRISIVRGSEDDGHLEWMRAVRATMLGNARDIYLYVPPGYDARRGERYAVLYMHDGNNLFHNAQPRSAPSTWDVDGVFEAQIEMNAARPGIIVGIPNNANRIGEYTHVPDDIGGGPRGGDGVLYGDFVVEDLKPLVDARYRTFPDRANTGVMGSSLGGLISFAIARQYPNVFGFVGGMSSTFYWGRFGANGPTMLDVYTAATDLVSSGQIFYLDSGGGPGIGCSSGGGADNYCETLEMRSILVAAGVATFPDNPDAVPLSPPELDIFHYWVPNAPHDENSWRERVHRPLRMFFRR